MYEDALGKHNDARAWVKQFQDTYDKARKAMKDAPDRAN
jgi:ABC-type Fe3+-hydroxamate transport system substrate-binding protein